jgi:hypothetical protein
VTIKEAIKIAFEKGYRVTEDGRLIGIKGNELKVKKRGNQRYPTFSVNVGSLTSSGVYGIPIHKFAAYCFYGDEVFEEGVVVRHLNGDTEDISKENILLGTYSDNERDKPVEVRKKAAKIARSHQKRPGNSLLTDEQVMEIKKRLKNKESMAAIARDYGVTRNCIFLIKKGVNYKDVI